MVYDMKKFILLLLLMTISSCNAETYDIISYTQHDSIGGCYIEDVSVVNNTIFITILNPHNIVITCYYGKYSVPINNWNGNIQFQTVTYYKSFPIYQGEHIYKLRNSVDENGKYCFNLAASPNNGVQSIQHTKYSN